MNVLIYYNGDVTGRPSIAYLDLTVRLMRSIVSLVWLVTSWSAQWCRCSRCALCIGGFQATGGPRGIADGIDMVLAVLSAVCRCGFVTCFVGGYGHGVVAWVALFVDGFTDLAS